MHMIAIICLCCWCLETSPKSPDKVHFDQNSHVGKGEAFFQSLIMGHSAEMQFPIKTEFSSSCKVLNQQLFLTITVFSIHCSEEPSFWYVIVPKKINYMTS